MEKELRHCFLFLKRHLARDWKYFGRCLNISEDELSRLSKDYKDDIEESIYQMLLFWKRKNGDLTTPDTLIEALEEISRKDLAEKLADIIPTRHSKGNDWTPDNQLGDSVMVDMTTYNQFKEKLASSLEKDDCMRLTNFFGTPKDQIEAIRSSDTPPEKFLLAMEEKGVLQPHNVEKLTEAFVELKMNTFCHVAEIYQKNRAQTTSYGRFLATLSAHLTGSLPAKLCDLLKLHEELKSSITLSQNPGLSLLLALDKMGFIKPSEVESLDQPFTELRLVQAVAKLHEYQSSLGEEIQLLKGVDLTIEDKVNVFIKCLQKKIKSWYETMTPVPWKKSCRWRTSDLFVGVGLILTDSKDKTNTTDFDTQPKLEYRDVLIHERLKSESRLILEGDPGSGKTMLSSQLAYDWVQGELKDTHILILLPLKFVEGTTLDVAIKRFYATESIPLTEKDIVSILERGDMSTVILLDGLEEYSSPMTKAEGKPSEVHEIMSKDKYPGCKVVLTSRSDFVHDLPRCPMLKLGRFSDIERNKYIDKVFANDEGKQREIKRIIMDNPFILDLCTVPLLFVLAVHNIESVERLQKDQLKRVTPFMGGMVDTLSPPFYKDRTQPLKLDEYEQGDASIEKLAFNGLCRGFQQLSWSKDFMDDNIDNVKELIDSGVLVVEEGIAVVTEDEENLENQVMKEAMETMQSEMDNVPVEVEGSSLSEQVQREPSVSRIKSTQLSSGSTATNFPLQLKFLHKLFQEWFAAKYLSSMIWFKNKKSFSNQLALIDPIDLHYVLRFTCYLCPPICHIVLNHLLDKYRSSEGFIQKHIMDCICLCYTEYHGYMGDDIKLAVSGICKETIAIQSMDSRLLQQSKIAILKFASQSEIPITKVQLLDVVNNTYLISNSGFPMNKLHTLHHIEVSQWNRKPKEEDYRNLLNFIATSKCVKIVSLYFPNNPPTLQPSTLDEISSKHIAVDWHIGQLKYTLDASQKVWMIDQIPTLSAVEVNPDFITDDLEGGSTPVALPGTSSASTSLKQEQLKRPVKELGCEVVIPKKLTKVDLSRKDKSLLEGKEASWKTGSRPRQTTNAKTEGKKVDFTKYEKPALECGQPTEKKAIPHHPVLETKATITTGGATVKIPDTLVELTIPPGALPKDMNECEIKLRIIPRSMLKSPATSFSSYSSVVVELLPNNLKLSCNAKIVLPHCLLLQQGAEYKAQIFMSHHEEGDNPQ